MNNELFEKANRLNETRDQLQQVFETKPADNTAEKTPVTGKGSNGKTAA